MATAVLVEVATGVTEALRDAQWSQDFTPERSYADWDEKLEDLGYLHVDVAPLQNGHRNLELVARNLLEYEIGIDIGIRKRLDDTDQYASTGKLDVSELDKLVLLLEEIAEYFATDRLADHEAAIWKETNIVLTYSKKHLRQNRQYMGIVRLVFDVKKAA